jgi:hypothetical protein
MIDYNIKLRTKIVALIGYVLATAFRAFFHTTGRVRYVASRRQLLISYKPAITTTVARAFVDIGLTVIEAGAIRCILDITTKELVTQITSRILAHKVNPF